MVGGCANYRAQRLRQRMQDGYDDVASNRLQPLQHVRELRHYANSDILIRVESSMAQKPGMALVFVGLTSVGRYWGSGELRSPWPTEVSPTTPAEVPWRFRICGALAWRGSGKAARAARLCHP